MVLVLFASLGDLPQIADLEAPTLVAGRAGGFVPVSEHLPQRSSPFRHAGFDKLLEFGRGWSSSSPGAGFGGEEAGVFSNKIPRDSPGVSKIARPVVWQGSNSRCLTPFPS